MAQTCSRCSRINPAEAAYCYFDGSLLDGHSRTGTHAADTFPMPFVFSSGLACRSFDELALGCLDNWPAALDFLQQGFLERFLGGLGRADLAVAARAAANFPDPERGLDQLLSRLPTKNVPAPKIKVPGEVSLPPLKVGDQRQLDLRISNEGRRLLQGNVVSDSKWLTLGDGSGNSQKLFQCCGEASVCLRVRGEHLHAGNKPLEGRLLIESNGGTATVVVRVSVPVRPFPAGVLSGAQSPRQLAEKAKVAPKEAALFFQNGAVAEWYKANGWTYPILGPSPSGVAAVQQFFEALGLVRAPKVEISEQALHLQGSVGQRLQRALQVRSPEKRPVFAQASSDQPWLAVGPVQPSGAAAIIPLEVSSVPGATGQVLQARVIVTANGNQRFVVPVSLSVGAAAVGSALPVAAVPRSLAGAVTVVPVAVATMPRMSVSEKSRPVTPPPPTRTRKDDPDADRQRRQRVSPLAHLAPLGLLLLTLFIVTVIDLFSNAPRAVEVAVGDEPNEEKAPLVTAPPVVKIEDEPDERTEAVSLPVQYEIKDEPEVREAVVLPVTVDIKDEPQEGGGAGPALDIDPRPRLNIRYRGNGRFGVSVADTGKRITYSPDGATNTCVVSLDGKTGEFGSAGEREVFTPLAGGEGGRAVWKLANLEFTQTLELVPSKQPVEVAPGVQKRLLDTLLVRYSIRNQDKRAHTVGLRLELDTLIGGNDGVPFTVPGLPGLVTTFRDFPTAKSVPDFIQALEVANLQNPGTVAHLTLKVDGRLEPPARVSLTAWSANNPTWNVPVTPMGGDSAAVLYWNPKSLAPGKVREFGFAYGLGGVSSSEAAGRLGITLGGGFEPGQVFSVTAYVTNPAAGQTLTLDLPAGLDRVEGEQTQPVQGAGGGATSTVTWKAKVLQTGVFPLRVRSSNGLAQTKTITIARPEGPSGGNVALQLAGSFEPGKVFDVMAKVASPVEGQTLTLKLPAGLSRATGAEVERVPVPVGGVSTVVWKVQVDDVGKFPVRVQSSTGVVQTKTITIVRQDQNSGKVALNLSGDFAPGKVFTVAAKVTNPVRDQGLTLGLASGLQRLEGAELQKVPPAEVKDGSSTVVWKVKVNQPGKHSVSVQSTTGVTLKKTVMVERTDDNAGRFVFDLTGDIGLNKDFTVMAKVTNPVPGQRLTLTLAKGLQLKEGDVEQVVPALPGGSRQGVSGVTWTVRVQELGRLPVRVQSTTGVARTKTLTITGAEGTGQIFGR